MSKCKKHIRNTQWWNGGDYIVAAALYGANLNIIRMDGSDAFFFL